MGTNDSFVHLHNHTEYSMLDGAARVGELLDEAVAQGMPAIAVTDHGNMFGAYEFWQQAVNGTLLLLAITADRVASNRRERVAAKEVVS